MSRQLGTGMVVAISLGIPAFAQGLELPLLLEEPPPPDGGMMMEELPPPPEGGRCIEKGPRCESDADCKGFMCAGGYCAVPGDECTTATDCSTRLCIGLGDPCKQPSDCPDLGQCLAKEGRCAVLLGDPGELTRCPPDQPDCALFDCDPAQPGCLPPLGQCPVDAPECMTFQAEDEHTGSDAGVPTGSEGSDTSGSGNVACAEGDTSCQDQTADKDPQVPQICSVGAPGLGGGSLLGLLSAGLGIFVAKRRRRS